jgi:hypothetical protein
MDIEIEESMNDNISMYTKIEWSMNDNIRMDTKIEGSMNDNIDMDLMFSFIDPSISVAMLM